MTEPLFRYLDNGFVVGSNSAEAKLSENASVCEWVGAVAQILLTLEIG